MIRNEHGIIVRHPGELATDSECHNCALRFEMFDTVHQTDIRK
jgi:hypothetical protein